MKDMWAMVMKISNLNKGFLRLAIAFSFIYGGIVGYIKEPTNPPIFSPTLEKQAIAELVKPVCRYSKLSSAYSGVEPNIEYFYIVIAHSDYDDKGKEIGFTTADKDCPALKSLAEFIGHDELEKKDVFAVVDLTPDYIQKLVANGYSKIRWDYFKYKFSAVFSALISLWMFFVCLYGLGFLVRWVYKGFKN